MLRFSYNELARASIERGLPRFHLRPKLHILEHIAVEFKGLNPRYFANYLVEDAVRRFQTLASASPARYMSHHVMFRYVVQMCLAFR